MSQSEKKKIEKQKKEIIKLKEELRNLKRETKKQLVTMITSAFGFASALFWRDAVQSLLQQIFGVKPGEGFWLTQFFIALGVTFVTAIIIFSLSRTIKG